MPVMVMNAAGQLETVYEHKVMRAEVARYLIAVSQHMHTVNDKHELRDPRNPRAIASILLEEARPVGAGRRAQHASRRARREAGREQITREHEGLAGDADEAVRAARPAAPSRISSAVL